MARAGHGAALNIGRHGDTVRRRTPGRAGQAQQHRARIALGGDPGRGVHPRQHHRIRMTAGRKPGRKLVQNGRTGAGCCRHR